MPTEYTISRRGLSWRDRDTLTRIARGLDPYARPAKEAGWMRFRRAKLSMLQEGGFIEKVDGKWRITHAAKQRRRPAREYSAAEDRTIRELYSELGPTALGRRLDRTPRGIADRARRIGAERYVR